MDQNPVPEKQTEAKAAPEISEVASLGTIFIEPERTFKDFKRKPRFIIATLILALMATGFTLAMNYKIGEANFRTFIAEQLDKNPRADSMTSEQKSGAVEMQMTINRYVRYAIPIFVFIFIAIGALLFWLGAKAFGGTGTYLENLAVWVYSGLPPAIVSLVGNSVVLALKSADDIDIAASQRGLMHANPSFFISGKEMPILATFLSTFDVFAIWGWVLAAIGIAVVNKVSKASAWSLVLIFIVIGLGFRLVGAYFSGNPA